AVFAQNAAEPRHPCLSGACPPKPPWRRRRTISHRIGKWLSIEAYVNCRFGNEEGLMSLDVVVRLLSALAARVAGGAVEPIRRATSGSAFSDEASSSRSEWPCDGRWCSRSRSTIRRSGRGP